MDTILDVIKRQHQEVRTGYAAFQRAEGADKEDIGATLLDDIAVHAEAEEEILYVAIREMGEESEREFIAEAEAEHDAARALVDELRDMESSDEGYESSFISLMEAVEDHMTTEEEEIFPLVQRLLPDKLEQLGKAMEERSKQLYASVLAQA